MAVIIVAIKDQLARIQTSESYPVVMDKLYFRAPNFEVTDDATGRRVILNKNFVVMVQQEEGEENTPAYGTGRRPYEDL